MTRASAWRPLLTAALLGLSAIFAALAVDRGLPGALGGLVGAILLVALPGYALTYALFRSRDIDGPERIALVLGLGLSSAVAGGLLLSATPWGMNAGSWAALLAGLSVVALLVGALRETRSLRDRAAARGRESDPRADEPLVVPSTRTRRGWPTLGQVAMLTAALLITVSAIVVARVGATQQPYPGFTQLWAQPAGADSVTVGVTAHEGVATRYTLRLLVDGRQLGDDRTFELGQTETWQATLVVGVTADAPVVEAQLFRSGEAQVYRRVRVSVGDPAGRSIEP